MRIFCISFTALVLILATTSCVPGATATPLLPVVLDTTGVAITNSVKASAAVVPMQESHLSFVVPGLVKEVTVREGEQIQAGQTLVMLDMTELEFGVVAAEAALTSAEIDAALQRVRQKYTNRNDKVVYTSGPREKILIADAKVAQMRTTVESAKASLAQGTLVAPSIGTVIEVNVSAGEYVQPAQQVIVVADLENLQIETTDLSELNVAALKIGQTATVFIEALNEEFPGVVSAISPISDTIGGDVVFKVTIQLDEQPENLLWGMSADVEIQTEQ